MSVCWDMDRREWVPGKWDEKKGKAVITGRPHWKKILGEEGIAFVSDLLRRMIDYENHHGMKPLILTQEEALKWHKANDMCFEEGWDRFYFNGNGELCCASRIRLDRWHTDDDLVKEA